MDDSLECTPHERVGAGERRQRAAARFRRFFIPVGTVAVVSCLPGDEGCDPGPTQPLPDLDSIIVFSNMTVGVDFDPDGYDVNVYVPGRDSTSHHIDVNDTIRTYHDLPGERIWTLIVNVSDVSPNCSVVSTNPRPVHLAFGGRVEIGFRVDCVGAGTIRITNQTTGVDLDPDGFHVIAWGASGQLDVNGEVTFTSIPTGESEVNISGIAANCQLEGPNRRPVTVTRSATVDVAFVVACTAVDEPAVASVLVSPDNADVIVGATTTYTARTFDSGGAELTGRTITWSVADGGVATVDPMTGEVTGVAIGSTTVTATSEGVSDDAVVVVVAPPAGNLNRWIEPQGGNWGTAANWSKGAVPVPTDSVVIDLGGTYTVSLFQDARVADLMVGGPVQPILHHTGGTLTIDGAALFDTGSWYNLEGGTLSGGGTVTVNGYFGWTAGTMTGAGSTVLNSGPTISGALGAPMVLDTRDLNINGYLSWYGPMELRNGSAITVSPNAFVEISGIDIQHTTGAASTLSNAGQIRNLAGTSTIGVNFENSGFIWIESGTLTTTEALTNYGNLYVEDGELRATGSFTNNASLSVTNGSTIDIDGVFQHNDGASLGGEGILDLTDATVSAFDGDVSPGTGLSYYGVMTIPGTYAPSALSTLYVDISTFEGPHNDRIASEIVVLGGTLVVTTQSQLSLGDSFPIMTATSLSGTFANVTLPELDEGLVFNILFEAGTLWLLVQNAL